LYDPAKVGAWKGVPKFEDWFRKAGKTRGGQPPDDDPEGDPEPSPSPSKGPDQPDDGEIDMIRRKVKARLE